MNTRGEKLKGKLNSSFGKAKQATGVAIEDKKLQSKGMAQKAKGQSQQTRADVKGKFQKGLRAVGDAVEKAGHDIAHLVD